MKQFGFPKVEHLCRKDDFNLLFDKGKSFFIFPIRLIYSIEKSDSWDVKVGVVVPKRLFHHAVDRNRLKRQMRESYRLQKHLLFPLKESASYRIRLLFIYADKGMRPFLQIKKTFKSLINNIVSSCLEENGKKIK